jgi:hypothetical protein
MSASVKVIDKGYDALIARLDKAARERVLTVGVHEEEGAGDHDGKSIADIAAIHEFGLGVPQRSFIGAWADSTEAEHANDLRKMGEALVKGTITDPAQAFEQLGEKYVGEVQTRIAGGIAPPNAPATIARKGSSTPLIDTGILRSSITKRVT